MRSIATAVYCRILCSTILTIFCSSLRSSPQIVYESVGNVVDRHEGNTAGKAAVFGLLHTAGLKLPGAPGSLSLRLQQRLGHFLGQGGRSFSREEDLPAWWKSASRGADATDDSWSN